MSLLPAVTARNQLHVSRAGYVLCGFAVACWAPLIPLLQHNLDLSTAQVGQLVFCFGLGSVSGMFLSNLMLPRCGMRFTYTLLCTGSALSICVIALMPPFYVTLVTVTIFGVSIGGLDVTMNVFTAYIEKRFRMMLMSVLYAFYSVGEVGGAVFMMLLLSLSIPPSAAVIASVSVIYAAALFMAPAVMGIRGEKRKEGGSFARPSREVLAMACIVANTFMLGGAILDWSGLYLREQIDIRPELAAYGYCIVALCMLLLRLAARPLVRITGPVLCCAGGALISSVALLLMVLFPDPAVLTVCFVLIGCGMANLSPLATSAAGKQSKMPLVSAVAFISVCGYTALLFGPALLGVIASYAGLKGVFALMCALSALTAVLVLLNRRSLARTDPTRAVES